MLPMTIVPVALFSILDTLETLGELRFVFQLIVFVYLLYWLFITFNRVPVLFGVSAIVAGYFMLTHSVSLTILALAFFAFVLLGNQLQMLVWFGLAPIFNIFGIDLTGQRHLMEEQAKYMAARQGIPRDAEQMQQVYEGMEGNMDAHELEMMYQQQTARRRMG
jgi:signal transduction histidine kinase